jgi:hypothetical protein
MGTLLCDQPVKGLQFECLRRNVLVGIFISALP